MTGDRDLDALARLIADGKPEDFERLAELLQQGGAQQFTESTARRNYKVQPPISRTENASVVPMLPAFLRRWWQTL